MSSPFMSSPEETNDAPAAPAAGGAVNKLLTVALLAIVCVFGWKFFGPKPSLAGWNKDWNAGVAQAQSTGKPAVVLFTADWCPPCRLMQRELFENPAHAASLEALVVPVRVLDRMREEGRNAPVVDSLQRAFGVEAFPTLVVTRPGSGRFEKLEGFRGAAATLDWVASAAAR